MRQGSIEKKTVGRRYSNMTASLAAYLHRIIIGTYTFVCDVEIYDWISKRRGENGKVLAGKKGGIFGI